YALIIGGAVGNVFDRVVHGFVVDYLDFYWGNYHWPAFNLADMAICLGAAMIIFDGFRSKPDSTS
ncbi:peptidase A8, partial [Vibrio xuii]